MPVATLPRPAERVAIVSLILVFLCGGVCGAVVMSYWGHPSLHRQPTNGLTMSIKEWTEQLDLSPEQTRRLTSVLDDFSHYYDNLLADGNSRIMLILTPDQQLKYERMKQNHKP